MQLALKMSSHYSSLMSWLTTPADLRDIFYGWLLRVQPDQDVPRRRKIYFISDTIGVYCYIVMPFGLKNAGAIYRHAISTIFRSHLRKMIECYVDDIAVKSHDKNDHLRDLKIKFDIMRAYQLKINSTKSFLGVSSAKFLRFIITSKGIYLDPDKVKAIQSM